MSMSASMCILINFVFDQEFERSRFAAMESEFRTRSDEAPEQMRKIQDKTRVSERNRLLDTFKVFIGFFVKYLVMRT